MITLVAAMSRGRVIGQDGKLPWSHGSMLHDQFRYRRLIDNQIIAIGSGTYNPQDDYIKNAKHIFLLTTKDVEPADNLTAVSSLHPILETAKLKDVFVVGGAAVFKEFMPHADKLELTYIDADYEGDKFFPEFNDSDWQVINDEAHPADNDNKHSYRFVTLARSAG